MRKPLRTSTPGFWVLAVCFVCLVPRAAGDPRIVQRYERRLNTLARTANQGKPVIVNGKMKRYKCIEEYVLLDKYGNVIEKEEPLYSPDTLQRHALPSDHRLQQTAKPSYMHFTEPNRMGLFDLFVTSTPKASTVSTDPTTTTSTTTPVTTTTTMTTTTSTPRPTRPPTTASFVPALLELRRTTMEEGIAPHGLHVQKLRPTHAATPIASKESDGVFVENSIRPLPTVEQHVMPSQPEIRPEIRRYKPASFGRFHGRGYQRRPMLQQEYDDYQYYEDRDYNEDDTSYRSAPTFRQGLFVKQGYEAADYDSPLGHRKRLSPGGKRRYSNPYMDRKTPLVMANDDPYPRRQFAAATVRKGLQPLELEDEWPKPITLSSPPENPPAYVTQTPPYFETNKINQPVASVRPAPVLAPLPLAPSSFMQASEVVSNTRGMLPPATTTARPTINLQKMTPENCKKVRSIADTYMVRDPQHWVRQNCALARMFVPDATCEQLAAFVDSCYRHRFL